MCYLKSNVKNHINPIFLFDDYAGVCVLLAQYINNLDSLFVPKQLHSLTNPFTL